MGIVQEDNALQSVAVERIPNVLPGGDGNVTLEEEGERKNRKRLADRQRKSRSRQSVHIQLRLAGRHYIPDYEYSQHPSVDIGKMNIVCKFCRAMKFRHEAPGM